MPSISREDYLKHILLRRPPGEAEREAFVPMGQLAEAVGVAGASVTGMVKSLVEAGLVEYEPYHGVRLTPAGERAAISVVRRHRLIELFLVRTLGLDWAEVHDEAERLEHAVSDRLIEQLDAFLGHPTVDPHGDPIPGPAGQVLQAELRRLSDCAPGQRVRIVRVTEQASAFLQFVERVGLRPGASVRIVSADPVGGTVTVGPEGGMSVAIKLDAASKLMVEPTP